MPLNATMPLNTQLWTGRVGPVDVSRGVQVRPQRRKISKSGPESRDSWSRGPSPVSETILVVLSRGLYVIFSYTLHLKY